MITENNILAVARVDETYTGVNKHVWLINRTGSNNESFYMHLLYIASIFVLFR